VTLPDAHRHFCDRAAQIRSNDQIWQSCTSNYDATTTLLQRGYLKRISAVLILRIEKLWCAIFLSMILNAFSDTAK